MFPAAVKFLKFGKYTSSRVRTEPGLRNHGLVKRISIDILKPGPPAPYHLTGYQQDTEWISELTTVRRKDLNLISSYCLNRSHEFDPGKAGAYSHPLIQASG